jgi:hypothetical protein
MFALDREETGFDGDELVHPAVVTDDLAQVAEDATEVWRHYEVHETRAPVTWEIHQSVVELRGIYYFLDQGDRDPRVEKLGRVPSPEGAIEAARRHM